MSAPTLDIGIAIRAMPAKPPEPSGDAGIARTGDDGNLLALIDGLGHGEKAHRIAEQAREEIERRDPDEPLDQLMAALIERFRGSRGFVLALTRIDPTNASLTFCGIGNITTRLLTDAAGTLVSGPGIVGQYSARPRLQKFPFPQGAALVMHSDGISSHLRTNDLNEALDMPAEAAAWRMIARHARPTDDAGVIVARRLR